MSFIENLNKVMKQRGISAYKLSQNTGIPQSTISSWKSTFPSLDKFEKIVRYLEISADELLDTGDSYNKNYFSSDEKTLIVHFREADQRGKENILEIAEKEACRNTKSKSSDSRIG